MQFGGELLAFAATWTQAVIDYWICSVVSKDYKLEFRCFPPPMLYLHIWPSVSPVCSRGLSLSVCSVSFWLVYCSLNVYQGVCSGSEENLGILTVGYLGDLLVSEQSSQKLISNFQQTVQVLDRLDWILNLKKSALAIIWST